MMTIKTIESWAIGAYADNELEGGERAEVERLIAESPEAQAELAAIRREKQALKAAFGAVVDEDIPPAMLRIVSQGASAQHRHAMPAWAAMAAAVAMLVIGAGGGWFAGLRSESGQGGLAFADAALGAHQVYASEIRHPVEVPATEQAHLQQWLSKRVGVAFKVPDLSEYGYNLLGGRLLAEGKKPAALLMYEDATKRRLTVYLAGNEQGTSESLQMRQAGKFTVCSWEEPQLVYAFVGEMPEAEMKQLAEAAHDLFES